MLHGASDMLTCFHGTALRVFRPKRMYVALSFVRPGGVEEAARKAKATDFPGMG